MEFGFYVLYFCLGVLLTITLLHERIWPKAQASVPDIKHNALLDKIETLSARVSSLEHIKRTKIDLVEFSDAIKLVMKEHQEFRRLATEDRERISLIVNNLLASYRPRESKKGATA